MTRIEKVSEIVHHVKVSIGMPVYNGEIYIREALDSLLSQDFKNFELIISDNASTDRTEEICRAYECRDHRIRYLRQCKNRGPTANFELVLKEAVGDYFMWAAVDDRWHPEFVSQTVAVLDENPDVGLVFTGMVVEDFSTGGKIKYTTGFCSSKRKWFRYIFRMVQCSSNLIYGMHRREVIKRIELQVFDFFDVYLTRWYELESSVRVIPRYLFTSGSMGKRRPYSISGVKIRIAPFLKAEKILLRRHFNFLIVNIIHLLSLMQRSFQKLQ